MSCAGATDLYNSIDALVQPVRDDALRPLSGQYLRRLSQGGGKLLRRQELPEEAFFLPTDDEEFERWSVNQRKNFFIALSYRWLSQGHPDPEGFHLKVVATVLKVHLEYWRVLGEKEKDVGMFWDFGSLYQNPRLDNQEDLFKMGLTASNIWYGSSQSTVWLQPHLPLGFVGPAYDTSGWCFVEASISSVIKSSDSRLDLGKLKIDDHGGIQIPHFYHDLKNKCKYGRMPPLTPDMVARKLKKEKQFTNDSDVSKVASLYKRFFDAVSTSTETLEFQKCAWTATEMVGFAEALPFFTEVRNLDLSENNLSDEGTKFLANGLANSSLTVLNLSRNKVGAAGAVALAEALKANSSLTVLNLSYNNVGAAGAVALAEALKANSSLTELTLMGNKVGDAGAYALAEALEANSALTELHLENNDVGAAGAVALAEALKATSSLTVLYLWGNGVGDAGAVALAEALKANSALTVLHLSGNKVGAAGAVALAEALKANSALTELHLRNNDVGAAGAVALAEALKANSSLTVLELFKNGVGDAGAVALAEALKANTTLTKLYLDLNSVGENGVIALAAALKANSALTELTLIGNKVGDAGAVALAGALKVRGDDLKIQF